MLSCSYLISLFLSCGVSMDNVKPNAKVGGGGGFTFNRPGFLRKELNTEVSNLKFF